MLKIKTQKNKGFVLLFVIVLSSIILSVTLGMANIAFREIGFNTSAKASNDAFFAADAGAECALYYDLTSPLNLDPNNTSTVSVFGVDTIFVNTSCGGSFISLDNTILNSNPPIYYFYLNGLGNESKACAYVTLTRSTTDPVVTTIVSKGYNTGGDTECVSTNPNRVERQIEVTY